VEPPDGPDALATLTPADFALVHRRALLTGEDDDPAPLVGLLAAECEGCDHGKAMGFRAA